MSNAIEPEGRGYAIQASEAPNEDQRGFMANRVSEIANCLAPAPEPGRLSEIAALLRTMAVRAGDEQEMSAVIRVYMADLADLPMFALSSACSDFRRGVVGGGKFAPTPAEIRKQAAKYTEPWAAERAKLSRILDARVLPAPTEKSEGRKAAALAHARETIAMLKEAIQPGFEKRETYRVPTRAEAEEWLQRCQASPPTLALSPYLRSKLGLPNEDSARADAQAAE